MAAWQEAPNGDQPGGSRHPYVSVIRDCTDHRGRVPYVNVKAFFRKTFGVFLEN